MNMLHKANAERISHLYFPTEGSGGWSFDAFVNHRPIRYFSYGRHALCEALRVIGVTKGDSVLLPGFICRDVLSSINTIGAIPVYYQVDKHMQLADDPDSLIQAKAILMVNYFGFPQKLSPFQHYRRKTGAVVIEDNAHGFLSLDEEGKALGTRGDIGIFSLRKTLTLPNGSAMVVNAHDKGYTVKQQIEPEKKEVSISFAAKRFLKKAPQLANLRMIRFLTDITRTVRKITSGHRIVPSAVDAEFSLPGNAAPCIELQHSLYYLDEKKETSRRRELYSLLDSIMRHNGFNPVFTTMSAQMVPYAYPFYASGSQVNRAKKVLSMVNLECYSWPELPNAVATEAPDEYKSVWMIPFLW